MFQIYHLCVNGRPSDSVIDEPCPRFSWRLRTTVESPGLALVAFRVQVRQARAAGIADSGWVMANDTAYRFERGLPLVSDTQYDWRVSVRWRTPDGLHGEAHSSWSEFHTGLMEPQDWHGAAWLGVEAESAWLDRWEQRKQIDRQSPIAVPAGRRDQWLDIWQWRQRYESTPIEPNPTFRRRFSISTEIDAATLYCCGLGYLEAKINGVRVGEDTLDPAWSDYTRTIYYRRFDVTGLLRQGENEIDCLLGRGFYCMPTGHKRFDGTKWRGQPKLLAWLSWRDIKGRSGHLVSDASWEVTDSHVVFDAHWPGEIHDRSRPTPAPSKAVVVEPPPGQLRVQPIAGIKPFEGIRPSTVRRVTVDRHLVEFPQVVGGRIRLRLPAAQSGRRITILYSERPPTDEQRLPWRHVYQQFGLVPGEDTAIFHEPHFTTTSFRWIEIVGYRGELTADDLLAVPVHSPMPSAASFDCDVPVITKIHKAVGNTLQANWMGLPTDCPNREKVGWTGDGHLACETTYAMFEVEPLFRKWIRDLFDAQRDDGQFPAFAPDPGWAPVVDPNWSAVAVLVPWQHYVTTGDLQLLAECYPGMRRYVLSIESERSADAGPHIVRGMFGDWLPPDAISFPWSGPESGEPYGTAYYYIVTRRLADIAHVLGKHEDATMFGRRADAIRQAFHAAFYSPDDGCYHSARRTQFRQSLQAVALFAGLVPDDQTPRVLQSLVDDIRNLRNGHLNTGFVGTRSLMDVLPASPNASIAAQLVANTTYPSWGYWLEHQNGTTIAENWMGVDETGSLNHPPLCSVGAYIIKYIGGIQPDPTAPAYGRVIFDPKGAPIVRSAKTVLQTIRGEVACEWRWDKADSFTEISLPPGAEGVVRLDGRDIRCNDSPLSNCDRHSGLLDAANQDDAWTIRVRSGRYRFEYCVARPVGGH